MQENSFFPIYPLEGLKLLYDAKIDF